MYLHLVLWYLRAAVCSGLHWHARLGGERKFQWPTGSTGDGTTATFNISATAFANRNPS